MITLLLWLLWIYLGGVAIFTFVSLVAWVILPITPIWVSFVYGITWPYLIYQLNKNTQENKRRGF